MNLISESTYASPCTSEFLFAGRRCMNSGKSCKGNSGRTGSTWIFSCSATGRRLTRSELRGQRMRIGTKTKPHHITDDRLVGFIGGAVELTDEEQKHMCDCEVC